VPAKKITEIPVPDDFPRDITVPKGVVFVRVQRMPGAYQVDAIARNATATGLADVIKDGMAKNGWTLSGDQVSPRSAILPFRKGKRNCGISMARDADEMDVFGITFQLTEQPERPSPPKAQKNATKAPTP